MGLADLPLRDDLRGQTPYGAPQLDVAVRLNTNENPFPPGPEVVRSIAARVSDVTTGLNRYPDRDAVALRQALAAYAGDRTGVAVTAANIWPGRRWQIRQSGFSGLNRSSTAWPRYSPASRTAD